ncbi:hypothetical protein SDC9_76013 [bioreactor metagenome]|uniref:Uncharacterized protein n=1 Tax=bioreactor metagenome TaxID=1076179 RepID=A0A644YSM0_9ZZZZ
MLARLSPAPGKSTSATGEKRETSSRAYASCRAVMPGKMGSYPSVMRPSRPILGFDIWKSSCVLGVGNVFLLDRAHAHSFDDALLEDGIDGERGDGAHQKTRVLERRIAGVTAD